MIQILTDSTSGIRQEEANTLGITVLPVNIDFDNEIFYDGVNLSPEEFWNKLGATPSLPATLPPNALEYLDRFEDAKKNNDPLLVITLSSALSVIYNSAKLYASEVDYENIEVVDSKTIGYGLRLLVEEAIKHREDMTLPQLVDHLEKFKLHIHSYAVVDNLDLLIKSDRITNNALPKCVLNIKPIITLQNGSITYVDKKVGTKNAQDFVISLIKNSTLNPDYPLSVEFVSDASKIDYPASTLAQLFTTKTITSAPLPYLLGAYLTPTATVFTFVTK